jgi:hypothetical protein
MQLPHRQELQQQCYRSKKKIIIAKMQHLEKRKSIAKATTAAAIATDVATATDAKPQNRTGDKNCNSWKS